MWVAPWGWEIGQDEIKGKKGESGEWVLLLHSACTQVHTHEHTCACMCMCPVCSEVSIHYMPPPLWCPHPTTAPHSTEVHAESTEATSQNNCSSLEAVSREFGDRGSRLFNTRKLIFIIYISSPIHNHLYFSLLNKHLRYNFYKASGIIVKASEIQKQVVLKLLFLSWSKWNTNIESTNSANQIQTLYEFPARNHLSLKLWYKCHKKT